MLTIDFHLLVIDTYLFLFQQMVQGMIYLIQKMPSAPQINNGFSEHNVETE